MILALARPRAAQDRFGRHPDAKALRARLCELPREIDLGDSVFLFLLQENELAVMHRTRLDRVGTVGHDLASTHLGISEICGDGCRPNVRQNFFLTRGDGRRAQQRYQNQQQQTVHDHSLLFLLGSCEPVLNDS